MGCNWQLQGIASWECSQLYRLWQCPAPGYRARSLRRSIGRQRAGIFDLCTPGLHIKRGRCIGQRPRLSIGVCLARARQTQLLFTQLRFEVFQLGLDLLNRRAKVLPLIGIQRLRI